MHKKAESTRQNTAAVTDLQASQERAAAPHPPEIDLILSKPNPINYNFFYFLEFTKLSLSLSWSSSLLTKMDSLTLFFTGALVAVGIYWFLCVLGPAERKGKRAVDLSGGSISAEKVQDNYKQYWSFFRRPKEIETAEKVPDFVDTFYNLVTDIYEWGWGQSFHFSPSIPGKSHKDATRLHEEMAVDLIQVKPGQKILDVGCGVGGPMRAIASHSRANVVGITINEYQVNRARLHNKKAGLDALCEVVCGNFLQMPFDDNSFDGAYSIEATCHAPKLEEVYAEIYRVLKPGSMYVSYEWVTTEKFKAEDDEHVEVIQGIERGDALPGLRAYVDIAETAKKVGFEIVKEKDLASPPAEPWWTRLKMGRLAYWRNHIVVQILSAVGVAPKGTVDVHEMLFKTADYLTRGGETGIFSPMHMILCRKPESPEESS
jgi:24-methylenesterol C-methyltransferase